VVEVTDHGHPVVRIVPLRNRNRLDELLAQGGATAAEGSLDDLLDYKPPPLPPGVPTASQVLAELRGEDR
jgi:antitoxin (DNA-binding transcriptional repressor) of toxin-antitoxin stability system